MVELSGIFEALLKDLWSKFDTGNDGSVDGNEFETGVKKILPNASEDRIETVKQNLIKET